MGALCFVSRKSHSQAYTAGPDTPPRAVVRDGVAITLRDQKLTYFRNGKKVKDYKISSSKFGIGSTYGSNRTPLGVHAVNKKVGDGQPKGMVFKACRPTGEVVPIDASGRDPIVTRVIQIAGLEGFNGNSHTRRIYIHGTPEESKIGRPASYGCIRMRSDDVTDLYRRVYRGMPVAIERCSQTAYLAAQKNKKAARISIPTEIVAKLPTDDVQFRPRRKTNTAMARKKGKSSGKKLAKRGTGKKSATATKRRTGTAQLAQRKKRRT